MIAYIHTGHNQKDTMWLHLIRALRLPFAAASAFPFIFGSLIERLEFSAAKFALGLGSAVLLHLGANLINDYADSASGVDWQDRRYYNFFGGSKLIQEGIFSQKFFLAAAGVCFCLSAAFVLAVALLGRAPVTLLYYLFILLLGISYSAGPLRLSYRRFGEAAVFVLFGPAPVMGGYFIQTGVFPDMRSFLLSLPFGFLTASILFANEVPDYPEDLKGDKRTLVSLTGLRYAYLAYSFLVAMAFVAIGVCIAAGYLRQWALVSCAGLFPAFGAARLMRRHYGDKMKLVASSRLAIASQAVTGAFLIASLLL